MGLLLGLLYSNVGNGQQSITDRKGILFFVCINQVNRESLFSRHTAVASDHLTLGGLVLLYRLSD